LIAADAACRESNTQGRERRSHCSGKGMISRDAGHWVPAHNPRQSPQLAALGLLPPSRPCLHRAGLPPTAASAAVAGWHHPQVRLGSHKQGAAGRANVETAALGHVLALCGVGVQRRGAAVGPYELLAAGKMGSICDAYAGRNGPTALPAQPSPAALHASPRQQAAYVLTALSTTAEVPAQARPALGAEQVGPACRFRLVCFVCFWSLLNCALEPGYASAAALLLQPPR